MNEIINEVINRWLENDSTGENLYKNVDIKKLKIDLQRFSLQILFNTPKLEPYIKGKL